MEQQKKTGSKNRLHVLVDKEIHEWLKQQAERKEASIGKVVNDILWEAYEGGKSIRKRDLMNLYQALKKCLNDE
jgi:hypothetical protein